MQTIEATALQTPDDILAETDDKRIVVTTAAGIAPDGRDVPPSHRFGFLVALNRRDNGPAVEVVHCSATLPEAQEFQVKFVAYAQERGFAVHGAATYEDVARLGNELWNAGWDDAEP